MPRRFFLSFATCLVALTAVLDARAEMMQFTPDRDNTLYQDIDGVLSNGEGNFVFFGRTGFNADSRVHRFLVRFDVSAIPSDAVIDQVDISIETQRVPPGPIGGNLSLHRLTADWGEGESDANGLEGTGALAQTGDATWLHRFFDTQFWDAPGGDFVMQPSVIQSYGTGEEVITVNSTEDLVRDVQNWVKFPSQNFGWIVIGNEGVDFTARQVDSRERVNGSPVLLTVEYHIPSPTDTLGLELVTNQPVRPVVITNAGDGSNRLFVVEQAGRIRIIDLATDTLLPTPFLDITAAVDDAGNEQGLLGLAFHPDFENNRRFYVNYTYDPGAGLDRTRIAMYEASIGNPNIADTTETVILEFAQDFSNHNGGDLHFDPEGYLVIASGDGGSGNDPNNRAQTLTTLLGKMLRIDVDTPPGADGSVELCGLVQNYAIPPGNPYAGPDGGCDEILHYGMRNPWRFSFDAQTGDMFIGDVGQGLWEEIDFAPAGATNINFGWKICEGAHLRGETDILCEFGELPIIEYSRSSGNCSVTGGYVYRGGNRALRGRYVYGDYCSARIWIATNEGGTWVSELWNESPALESISTFGQDEQCELYVADFGSFDPGDESIYRIVDSENIDSSGFEALRCQ